MNDSGLSGSRQASRFGVPKWMLKWNSSKALLGPTAAPQGSDHREVEVVEDDEQRGTDRIGEPAPNPGGHIPPSRRVSDPADPDRDLYETGALLPGPHATLAGPTFEEWLDSTS
jgi:hypothetical protein